MGKQYTFKTTMYTEWIEEKLDSMPPRERSKFIRDAVILLLERGGNLVTQNVRQNVRQNVTPLDRQIVRHEDTPKVTPKVTQNVRQNVTPTPPREEPDFEEIEGVEIDIDLDSKLNSLYK